MNKKMKSTESKIGLWIDHRKCILVFIDNAGVKKKIIKSNAEKHPGRIDGKHSAEPFEAQMVKADDRQERHFAGQINAYFDEIISYISGAEYIFIFGPGEAKVEFLKHINKHKINGHIEEVEVADRMTDDQVVAKVKQHYFS